MQWILVAVLACYERRTRIELSCWCTPSILQCLLLGIGSDATSPSSNTSFDYAIHDPELCSLVRAARVWLEGKRQNLGPRPRNPDAVVDTCFGVEPKTWSIRTLYVKIYRLASLGGQSYPTD